MPGAYGTPIACPNPAVVQNPYVSVHAHAPYVSVHAHVDPVLSLLSPNATGPYGQEGFPDDAEIDPYNNTGDGRGSLSVQPPPIPVQPPVSQPVLPGAPPTGIVRDLKSKGPGYRTEESRNVKYIHDLKTRREKYQVTIGSTLMRRGQVFDTQAVKRVFISKGKGDQLCSATLGNNHRGEMFKTPRDWAEKALIWVCAPDLETDRPVFYSHVGKLHRFHHSSMVAGGDVIGAGEWIVSKGRLRKISANSGHYLPSMNYLYNAVLHMASAFTSDTVVFLYDQVDDRWVERPIRDFISRPSDGGRYKTHPKALG